MRKKTSLCIKYTIYSFEYWAQTKQFHSDHDLHHQTCELENHQIQSLLLCNPYEFLYYKLQQAIELIAQVYDEFYKRQLEI